MKAWRWLPAAGMVAIAAAGAVAGPPGEVRSGEITPQLRVAVGRGLDFLASRQQPGGALGPSGGHAGITALAAMAFMSGGNLPGRGEYGANVQRCLDYVLSQAGDDGLIAGDSSYGQMYGHAFATLFLAEVYGMSPDAAVKQRLARAVRVLLDAQSREGGWRYQAIPFDADISVTICCVMALRAARDAGMKVPGEAIDNAVDYVRRCQNSDGGFGYMPSGSESAFARSAAGVATLYYAGAYGGQDVQRGLRYLRACRGARDPEQAYFYYGHYYAAQAMLLAGGEHWAEYFPGIREQLLARQDARSGGWNADAGVDYGTAMALIILQMPNRSLPILHGKGPGN